MKITWKMTAIIFIVLFVLETLFLVFVFSVGIKALNNEAECQINICGGDDSITGYLYDSQTKICSCYSNGKIVKETLLK
jgi:hypothetical protein